MFSAKTVVSILLAALCCLVVGSTPVRALGVTTGYPFILLFVTPLPPATYDDTFFKTQIGLWIRTNQAVNGFGSLTVPTDVDILEISPGTTYEMKITLNTAKYGNGYMHEALKALSAGPINSVFGANYTVNSSSVDANYSPNIAISFDSFGRQYVGTQTNFLKMYTDFSPREGTSVTVFLNHPNVVSDPVGITIAYPKREASFKLTSGVVGTHVFSGRNITSADPGSFYQFYVTIPQLQVDALENVVITPPSATIINYNMTATDLYKITVPNTYRDALLRMIFTVKSSPAGLQVYFNNISLTQRGVDYSFYCIGPIGTFTLSYLIAAPWNVASQNNNYFNSPVITHTVSFVHALNITVGSIPEGYLVNPPATPDWGGAYSRLINLHIEKSPKKSLQVSISAPDCEVFPPVLSFSPGGLTMGQFRVRALSTGIKTVSFSLGGLSAADYYVPASKRWVVRGPNPACNKKTAITTCFDTSGCQWNSDRGFCSNTSLPISISPVPVLFDGEASANVTLTLATPVQGNLRIQFVATSRLVFTPAILNLPAGTKKANFTVTGFLNPRDGIIKQDFYLRLSGSDANYFKQETGLATIRPRIKCTVAYPPPFFVGTESENFVINCDGPPETEVFFTPIPRTGLQFVPNGMFLGLAVRLDHTTQSGTFFAMSVGGVVSFFDIGLTISGVNAPRFEAVPVVTVRTLPLASLNVLPNFHVTAFQRTPSLNIDLSVAPPNPITVTMTVYDKLTGLPPPAGTVTLTPPVILFNESQRQTVTATSIRIANYTIVYNISGINYRNYEKPLNSSFEVKDPADGNAFTYRLQPGFQPRTACRINVGRNSQVFQGQDAVDDATSICHSIPRLYANVSNGTTLCPAQATEERCRATLAATGTICYWNAGSCTYLSTLQGAVRDLAYGSSYVLFVTYNNSVYSIGSPLYGQLGHFSTGLAQVILPENISSVVAGTASSFALSFSGRVFAWGANGLGQLGINKNIQQTDAIYEIKFPKYENISCISAGSLHAGAISLSGKLFMWGSNLYGQTGNKATYRGYHRDYIVVNRDYFDGEPITSFQCGEFHTMVSTDSQAYAFGNNNQGQLGRPGFDEWQPAKTILWYPSRFVPQPGYTSFVRGTNCQQ